MTAARSALERFGDRARVVHAAFGDLTETVRRETEGDIVGILFDLGVSSPQLDRRSRGFSYWDDAPLDMRMDSSQSLTAAEVVNTYDEAELTTIIATFGEERFASRIAREIVARRPIATTGELVDAIKDATDSEKVEEARAALVDSLVTDALNLLGHLPGQRLSEQAANAVGLLALVVSPWVGKNMARYDARSFATFGFITFAAVVFMRSQFNTDATFEVLLWPTLLQGVAMGTFFTPLFSLT